MKEIIEFPCKLGSTVWVTPDNINFHSAILLGMKVNENNIQHRAYIVQIHDKERKWVNNPMSKTFIDYFVQIFTCEEMELKFPNQKEII